MIHYENGDVVLVSFPFSNLFVTKKRPAVVISSASFNKCTSDIVIIAITSNVIKENIVGDCILYDWENAGLLKPSTIKPAIATIEQKLIIKKLGILSKRDLYSLKISLQSLLNLK